MNTSMVLPKGERYTIKILLIEDGESTQFFDDLHFIGTWNQVVRKVLEIMTSKNIATEGLHLGVVVNDSRKKRVFAYDFGVVNRKGQYT